MTIRVGLIGLRRTTRVKTYGDALRQYEFHPKAKSADTAGESCDKQTVGLLQRGHICVDPVRHIDKNRISWRRSMVG
jgi:hypothetical protein